MITTAGMVKILAKMYDLIGVTAPTTSTVGALGQLYLDSVSGLTYMLTAINAGPSYVWTLDGSADILIDMAIGRATVDFLKIRGVDFELDEDNEIVYPTGADYTAAEMVCYLLSLGVYDGRGTASESLGGRSATYDEKLCGYPRSIVGTITRYAAAQ
jgi:hypothetical protein